MRHFHSYFVQAICTAACCFGLTHHASSAPILPSSYAMPNGQGGAFKYFDQAYTGSGDKTTNSAPLSGGVGELTDGVIPASSWNVTWEPFVGWLTENPTIRFSFPQPAEIDSVTLYFDDTEGVGGVDAPLSVRLANATDDNTFPVNDPPTRGQLVVPLTGLAFVGDWLDVTITKPSDRWVMLSEVQFTGEFVPEPTSSVLMLLGGAFVATKAARRKKAAIRTAA